MKTKAQESICCEGGTHCLGCGTKIESRFGLRCQVCWQKKKKATRHISFNSVGPGFEEPGPSGCCVICAAPTFGAAIFCRYCELTSYATHQSRGLLSAEQKDVVILEGVCERSKMRETPKDFETCLWCSLTLEERLQVGKCISCPQPTSRMGNQNNYQCNKCIFEQRRWKGRCKLCHDLQKPGQDTCKWSEETNVVNRFYDKYMGVEPEIWGPVYKEISRNAGSSGTQ